MALAQHHGVSTRLLDWTNLPYIALYFAASTTLARSSEWKDNKRLALWVLDKSKIPLYKTVKLVKVAGSVSRNLSAQSGLFTVQQHNGTRGAGFEIKGLEQEFIGTRKTPLKKLTLPVEESLKLFEYCSQVGISAATIYPSIDGAGKAVSDSFNAWAASRKMRLSL